MSFDVMSLGVQHVHGGQSKVLGIHDHYSTYTWVRLMKNETEDEFITCFREYRNFCSMHGVTPTHLHTDNFSSHVGDKVRAFMRDELKVHYTTITPNEPRQNGMMERQWRSMGNDTRAMLRHSQLPRNYAWYALEQSVMVANTLPITGNVDKCAHSLFTGHRPNVTQFRVWGCMAYAQVYNPLTKMADRAVRCINLGRCSHQPGFMLMDPETKKVHVSVHCKFVETECPGLTLAKEGWEQAMPSYADLHDDSATRVADAPILQDTRAVLEPGPQPLFAPEQFEDEVGQGAPAARHTDVQATPARPRRQGANYGNAVAPFNGAFEAVRATMMSLAESLKPGGKALGHQVLSLDQQARGSFILYLCSGVPREGDLQHWVKELSVAQVYVINVDTEIGGHSHDLRATVVTDRLVALAGSEQCLGVLATLPCGPWSAARFNGAGPQPLFNTLHPDGIPLADGTVPLQVQQALLVLRNATKVADAALARKARVVFENPVSRGAESQFAIAGRELHSPIWNTTVMSTFARRNGMQVVISDQCRSGAASQKTTQWLCSPGVYEAMQLRLGPLMCNHSRSEHAALVQPNGVADGSGGSDVLRFQTKDAERFPSQLNRSLAEVFLSPRGVDGWLNAVGTCIEPFTNNVLQSICYSLTDLHAISTAESGDPFEMLREMQVMQLEIDEPEGDALVAQLAPLAAVLHAQQAAMDVAGEQAHVSSLTSSSAFAQYKVSAADRKSGDNPSYKQAISGEEAAEWHDAMASEIGNFEQFGIFEEVPEDSLPTWDARRNRATETADMMWVLKKVYNELRELVKRKARGTIRGDQLKAIDVKLNRTPAETYAPTVRQCTCKMATAHACIRAYANKDNPKACKMRFRTSDATAAFLQGDQPKGVTRIVRPPEGFRKVDRRGVPIVWRLVGNCYGTDNAPRVWYETYLPVVCNDIGFCQSDVDPCFLYKYYPPCDKCPLGGWCYLCLYVDDEMVIDDAGAMCDEDMQRLSELFKFTVKEDPKLFLNMNVEIISPWKVKFSMEKYLLEMADECVPNWRAWAPVHMPATPRLQADYEVALAREHPVAASRVKSYRTKVGKLIYAAPAVRCDAAYAISRLARAQTFPTEALEGHADSLIVHLAQTASMGVTFDGSSARAGALFAESDSDWAVGHSTSGCVVYYCGVAVFFSSKRQACIAMSSTEAEIIAASACALVLVFCAKLAKEMGMTFEKPPLLFVDNSGAVELSRDRKSCHRSRHVDRRYFKVRELQALGELTVEHIPTAENSSDLLTKVLSYDAHVKHRARLLNLDPSRMINVD
jgi:hypothetical protein